jgi:hypothetical protein
MQGMSRNKLDDQRFEALKRSVSDLGYLRRGTVLRRFMTCGKPRCACKGTPRKLHGPYYQWSRKVHGKTVTVRLSDHEATQIREWIENGRRLDKIVSEMEKVSLRITQRRLRHPEPV